MRRVIVVFMLVISVAFTPHRAEAKGTHFLAEAELGIISGLSDPDSTDVGGAAAVLLGVGGRPRGSWLRYYLVLEVLTGSYGRTHYQNFRTVEIGRKLLDMGLGLRIVAPFTPNIRFFGDIEGVLIISSTDFSGDYAQEEEFDSSELDGGLRFGAGIHLRPIEALSIGARFSMTTAFSHFDDDGGRGWLIGFDSEYGHYETTLQLTLYF